MTKVFSKVLKLTYQIYPSYCYLLIIQALVNTGIVLFNSFYVSYIITLVTTKDYSTTIKSIIFLIGCDVCLSALMKILDKYNEYLVKYVARLFYKQVIMHLNKIEYQYVEDPKNQERVENVKFAIDSQGAIQMTFYYFTNFVMNLVTILAILGSLIFLEPWLILITLIGFVITILISLINYKASMKFFANLIPLNRRYSYYFSVLVVPQYQKDLRLYPLGKHMLKQLEIFSHKTENEFIKFSVKNSFINVLNVLCNYLELGIIYLLIAFQTITKKLGVANFTLQVNLATNLYTNLNSGFQNFVQLLRYRSYLKQVVEILNLPVATSGKVQLTEINTLEFKNVCFKYPNTTNLVLEDVSFLIKKGEKIALVGLNGAGKSTIVKLICRLYQPEKGQILINGLDINEYDSKSYYDCLSTVFQDYKLFALSLEDNILLGENKDITPILKELDLTGVIAKLPQGINSYYGKAFSEDGIELSGGETQKLAIARCLAKNSDFVILDEPTAALDPLAEANIYANFKELAKNRTAIYISHRLASAIFCDKVLVLDNGRIADYASHHDLMQKPASLYAKLFNLQKENYKTTKNQ